MSSAPVAALVVMLTMSLVLVTSGVAKARDPQATRDAFDALQVPGAVPADAAARILPWLEIALAVLLLSTPSGLLVLVSGAVALLMLLYTGLIARALTFDQPVTCSCFGALGRHQVDRTTLSRNVLLVLIAMASVGIAMDGTSVASATQALDREGWSTLVAAAAAVAVALLVGGGTSSPASGGEEELLDYQRLAIPYGAVTLPNGHTATLAELARAQARLLVVLNPGCRPCVRTAGRLDEWAARLAPAVGVLAVYPDEASATAASPHAPELAAWEPDLNIRRVFSVGTPAAVLLGADGLMAGGPVAGEVDVADFVDDVLAALVEQPGRSRGPSSFAARRRITRRILPSREQRDVQPG